MPHVVYLLPYIVCPWPGCGYRIELLDLQLEKSPDASLYASVIKSWGRDPNFGVVARCPGCRNFVFFGLSEKRAVADLSTTTAPILPDHWYLSAFIG